jgi:integrase
MLNRLTDTAIRNARPAEKPYRLYDGGGLYLEIRPNGNKWWRLKYRIHARENRLSLGTYPKVGLADARRRRDEAQARIAQGDDPALERRLRRQTPGRDFEAVARAWYAARCSRWAASYGPKVLRRLEVHVFPYIGRLSLAQITPQTLRPVLLRIADGEHGLETAHRTRRILSQVFRYAIIEGLADHDPAAALAGLLHPLTAPRHYPAITDPRDLGALLRAIDAYDGLIVRAALRMLALTFVRPGELRGMRWTEIRAVDLPTGRAPCWIIPASRMKGRREHLVPLAHQAQAILDDIRPLTGSSEYVFPTPRTMNRPLGNMALVAALRRLGYTKDQLVAHSFRAIASTLLHERGHDPQVIELQLAHVQSNKVAAAYNRAARLHDRVAMMQGWADYLDDLRRGNVVPIARMSRP